MVWSQQRLKLFDRFRRLLGEWEDYEKVISEFHDKCNLMDDDFELFTRFVSEDLQSKSPLTPFHLQEGLAALNEDYFEVLSKFLNSKQIFIEIEKKTRFLIAEVERTGSFEIITLCYHH